MEYYHARAEPPRETIEKFNIKARTFQPPPRDFSKIFLTSPLVCLANVRYIEIVHIKEKCFLGKGNFLCFIPYT